MVAWKPRTFAFATLHLLTDVHPRLATLPLRGSVDEIHLSTIHELTMLQSMKSISRCFNPNEASIP
jgi:hypothetical protein